MEFDYGFEYAMPDVVGGAAAGIITGIFMIVYFMAMAFSVISYVLNAVGMYRIAKRRGIHHAWLAWIPVGCNWLLGSISDHYQYVTKQKTTRRRKVLLTLNLIMIGATMAFSGAIVAVALSAGVGTGNVHASLALVMCAVMYLVIMGLGIAITVISYIAYYDLFRSCKPGNAVLFLILGVIFNVTLPFFVFFVSNSDEGMPARRSRQLEQLPCEEEEAEPKDEIPVVEAEIVEDPE